jgi:hypothetical protein
MKNIALHPAVVLDFVIDTLVSGRRFRILTLVDDFTRERFSLVADTSLLVRGSCASSIASSGQEAAPA